MSTTEATVTMVPVSTVAPAITDKELATTHRVILQCRRNSTEKNPIPEKDRSRWIVMQELSVPSVPSAFTSLVLDTLYKIARDQFDSLWTDNPQLSEVPAALFSVDSLLMYAAKRAEGGRLNNASIVSWFDTSTLMGKIQAADESKRPGAIKLYRDNGFAKLAAPVIEFNEEECTALLRRLDAEVDQEHTILKQMAARLRNRIASLKAQQTLAFAADGEI
jgi:hypothetical protein